MVVYPESSMLLMRVRHLLPDGLVDLRAALKALDRVEEERQALLAENESLRARLEGT